MLTTECKCTGCMEEEIYARGYCQECWDQNCEEDENH